MLPFSADLPKAEKSEHHKSSQLRKIWSSSKIPKHAPWTLTGLGRPKNKPQPIYQVHATQGPHCPFCSAILDPSSILCSWNSVEAFGMRHPRVKKQASQSWRAGGLAGWLAGRRAGRLAHMRAHAPAHACLRLCGRVHIPGGMQEALNISCPVPSGTHRDRRGGMHIQEDIRPLNLISDP